MTAEEREDFEFFINAPMRSAEHLMKKLYPSDAFYLQSTYAWVGADDAKKLFLYGVCKEVFKACIGLVSDEEVLQEAPDGEPDQMTRLITGTVTDVQTYRRRKLLELLVMLVLFDRKHSRDEEYRIFISAENLDLRLGEQQDFRDLHDGKSISNTQYSIDAFLKDISMHFCGWPFSPRGHSWVASSGGRQAGVRECAPRAVGRVHLLAPIRRSTSGWPAACAPFFLSRTLPHVSTRPIVSAARATGPPPRAHMWTVIPHG
jgi:hypothetical protein